MGGDSAQTVATWVWRVPGDVPDAVDFLTAHRVREAHLAVGRGGVDPATVAFADELRANGIAVSCLGGDPRWAVDHAAALQWLESAVSGWTFDGVHLDVEPWALPNWSRDQRLLMDSYAGLVAAVAERVALAVDLVPWLADGHRTAFERIVAHCDAVTVLAYRDTAARILADVRAARRICARAARRYRIGVETQPPSPPSIPADITFGDDGLAVMGRELAAIVIDDNLFDGFAIHQMESWRAMGA